jgi:hypothetical protein
VDKEGHDIPQNGEAIGEVIVRGNAVATTLVFLQRCNDVTLLTI